MSGGNAELQKSVVSTCHREQARPRLRGTSGSAAGREMARRRTIAASLGDTHGGGVVPVPPPREPERWRGREARRAAEARQDVASPPGEGWPLGKEWHCRRVMGAAAGGESCSAAKGGPRWRHRRAGAANLLRASPRFLGSRFSCAI